MSNKAFSRRSEWLIGALVTGGLAAILHFAFATRIQEARKSTCQSNLKQLGLAMLQYCRDYDEMFPMAAKWDALSPYAKNSELFHCPSASNGYAMNTHLSHANMARVTHPATTPALYDSMLGRKNAHDTGASWPSPPRHLEGNNMLYTDAHVKWLRQAPTFDPLPRPRPQLQRKRRQR